jgi:formate dehydrogenase iron-sulfur subunit
MCVKTCPTGTMAFGERDEILAEAERRLEALKPRFPKARLVDAGEVNVFFLLAEEPEHYHAYASFG